MPILIPAPTIIEAPGTPPKQILEYVGRVNSSTESISIAHMRSPAGWSEPGQQPEFDEFTLVLKGTLHVETRSETMQVQAGQAIQCRAGEWIRYSSPGAEGAEYIAVCLPAFSPDTVRRDDE
jgi:mannose-6-phosphate isomerase-like protein (cupin superfamily)